MTKCTACGHVGDLEVRRRRDMVLNLCIDWRACIKRFAGK